MRSRSHVAVTGRDLIAHIHEVVAKLPICSLGLPDKDVSKGGTSVHEAEADRSRAWQVKRRFLAPLVHIRVNTEKPCCLSRVDEIQMLCSAQHTEADFRCKASTSLFPRAAQLVLSVSGV